MMQTSAGVAAALGLGHAHGVDCVSVRPVVMLVGDRPGDDQGHAYSLLRTIRTSAVPVRPVPLVPYNPAHIRGAGDTKRVHRVEPATFEELDTIVDELPDRYKLMATPLPALLASWTTAQRARGSRCWS